MLVTISSDVDTLVLPGGPDVSAGDVWGVLADGLDGVWGGVDQRASETDNPSGGGSLWPGLVVPAARYVTVRFAHRSNTSAVAELEARDRIARLVGRRLTVGVDTDAGHREISGIIKTEPEFAHKDPRTCTCGVVIWCPDPLWRGLPVTVSGHWGGTGDGGLLYPLYDAAGFLEYTSGRPQNLLDVPNVGLEASWPVLRVAGATEWWRFVCGEQVVELHGASDEVVVDCRAGTVTAGGIDITGFLTRDDFFRIPAGGAVVSFQTSGQTQFSVEVAPAWL